MSGKPWTQAQKDAHAAKILARWQDPEYLARQSASWTPERRQDNGRRLRKRWKDPTYRKQQCANRRAEMADPGRRAVSRASMMKLVVQRRDNEKFRVKWLRANGRSRRTPAYRAIAAAVMSELMSRPEQRRASRARCLRMNRDPRMRKRQQAGRRRARAARGNHEQAAAPPC